VSKKWVIVILLALATGGGVYAWKSRVKPFDMAKFHNMVRVLRVGYSALVLSAKTPAGASGTPALAQVKADYLAWMRAMLIEKGGDCAAAKAELLAGAGAHRAKITQVGSTRGLPLDQQMVVIKAQVEGLERLQPSLEVFVGNCPKESSILERILTEAL
jgi:hypothetical protein